MEKQIVQLFVFNTLADWETGFAVAGINNPALQKHPGRYRVQTVGLDAEPVTTPARHCYLLCRLHYFE